MFTMTLVITKSLYYRALSLKNKKAEFSIFLKFHSIPSQVYCTVSMTSHLYIEVDVHTLHKRLFQVVKAFLI